MVKKKSNNISSNIETVGSRLKKVRKLLKIRQEDFAKSMNISETSLSHYETGKKFPPFEFLFNIATKYNASMEYIIIGKGEPFVREKSDFDDFDKDKPFGDFTDDVKEIFTYMKRSRWVLSVVIGFFKEYLSRNRENIENDIRDADKKK